jgi:hypothetical protein
MFVRDSRWTYVKPGVWLDPAGCPHYFPDEILAELGWEYNRENYETVLDVLRDLGSDVQVAAHHRELDA